MMREMRRWWWKWRWQMANGKWYMVYGRRGLRDGATIRAKGTRTHGILIIVLLCERVCGCVVLVTLLLPVFCIPLGFLFKLFPSSRRLGLRLERNLWIGLARFASPRKRLYVFRHPKVPCIIYGICAIHRPISKCVIWPKSIIEWHPLIKWLGDSSQVNALVINERGVTILQHRTNSS